MKCDIVSFLLFASFLVGAVSGTCFESKSGNFLSADSSWTVSSSPTCGDMEEWLWCDYGSGQYYGIWHVESSFSPEPTSNPHVFLGDSGSGLELIERSKFIIHTDQKWIPEENGDGTVSFRNKESDLYLTAGSNGYAGLSNEIGPDQKFLL